MIGESLPEYSFILETGKVRDISSNLVSEFTEYILHTSPHSMCRDFVLPMWFYYRWFEEWLQGTTPLQSSICSYNQLLSSNLFLFCSSHLSLWHHLGYSLHLLKTTCYLYKRCFKTNCTLIVDTLNRHIFYNQSVEII